MNKRSLICGEYWFLSILSKYYQYFLFFFFLKGVFIQDILAVNRLLDVCHMVIFIVHIHVNCLQDWKKQEFTVLLAAL